MPEAEKLEQEKEIEDLQVDNSASLSWGCVCGLEFDFLISSFCVCNCRLEQILVSFTSQPMVS